jgi:hypothetical protein
MVRWQEHIRATGELTIFAGQSVTGSSWAGVFSEAVVEFNKLSSKHGLGVTLRRSSEKPTNAQMGANVQFEAISGTVTFSSFVGPVDVTVGGTDIEGFTAGVQSGLPGRLGEGQAFVCVPNTPQGLAGPVGQQKVREVGDPVKLAIAVHELVHACGLNNIDHTKESDPDLFVANPQFLPDNSDPAKDKLEVGRKKVPDAQGALFLAPQTVNKIKALWLFPNPIVNPFPRVIL